MTNADTATDEHKRLAGVTLQLEIQLTLTKLLELVPMVAALADSRQRGVGFMSYDARQIENAMIRKERRQLLEAIKDGKPFGHGTTAAPGNIAAISAYVEIGTAAQHGAWRLTRWLGRNGIRVRLEAAPDQSYVAGASVIQLLTTLRSLIAEISDDDLLNAVLDDLEHVRDLAERLIDGNDRALLDVPCPHCGRKTLVVTFKDGLITCSKDHATGKRHPCTCTDPLCECKQRPLAHRHTWHRARGNKPGGWLNLAKQISAAQRRKGTR